ncbi:siderophore-iron reductase FhuF [Arsenophonus apicola]|uniref:Siderophore-iron reductase FhuF n=1 Tax=Arsenophonus apicola TaxID=2879119 RepID=A0ABY8P152_9GAMM|nr:siderophore-iron reductase FhuF [Arsenophonus apicola]WGO83222.1 siderophore-iron reductase FhuF [Arsenophonus apicola]
MGNKNNDSSIAIIPKIEIADITKLFDSQFSHFNSSFKVNEENISTNCMEFYQWSKEKQFLSLMARYQYEYYGNSSQNANQKGLYSLWAQWYFGLVIPPMMLMLLEYPQAINTSYHRVSIEFHASGRPNIVYYQLAWMAKPLSLLERYHDLLQQHIIPVCKKIEFYRGINGRLLWNNIGYIMYWYLMNFKEKLDANQYNNLINMLFFEKKMLNNQDNPLYRTVIVRNNVIQRRSCCQRNKLPGVGNCHDCPLEAMASI